MKVIATHENTDFDGFAALVAAAKLFTDALAVIPRQMNRNVHDFVTLYHGDLPIYWHEDLPKENIETLILVDTHSPPQLKGVGAETHYIIIDHHSLDNPRPNATYDLDVTGAATTMLVERLNEAGISINPLEATLFLQGIYEDTGNLSYSTTTSRDARVVAYLLEIGANLQVASRFLSYPLTDEQRELYNLLLQNVETLDVEGVNVVIVSAAVPEYVDEISVLAHRLRDLFDPDVLFLLVRMTDHVQMVARSSNNTIDVGKVAVHLKGGGHKRAAAALIRDRSLEEVRQDLIAYLPSAVEPTTTVRQIMSYGVHVVSPDTRVAEVSDLMQRYGHEGFPVVDGDKVVGIITRLEVDRAMRHGLERAPVRVYKRAEGVSVSPENSVRELQRLMTEHNIGQVPVVAGGKVIGIVTRTDLLKLWATSDGEDKQPDISQRLRQTLPEPLWQLLQTAAQVADDKGFNLYVVGGFVRDLLLGFPNLDLDLVVEGDAIALTQDLVEMLGGEVRSHKRFGTAKWFLEEVWEKMGVGGDAQLPEHVDFATARTEFYEKPSALPVVERSSIKQDLHRRDFTINTLAVSLNPEQFGRVYDFYGGLRDLEEGLIRVLHSLSFVEDPTRMLRAVRLEARLGFRIEERTADLIENALELLVRTSDERVSHELMLMLSESEPERAMVRLQELDILRQISASLTVDSEIVTAMVAARETAPEWPVDAADLAGVYISLMAWHADAVEIGELVARLRLPKNLAQQLSALPDVRKALVSLSVADLSPSQIYQLLEGCPAGTLLAAYAISNDRLARERLLHFQHCWRHVTPQITGDDLRQWGLKPGPVYRDILEALRASVLDGIVSGKEEEERLVRRWLEEGRFKAPLKEGEKV